MQSMLVFFNPHVADPCSLLRVPCALAGDPCAMSSRSSYALVFLRKSS